MKRSILLSVLLLIFMINITAQEDTSKVTPDDLKAKIEELKGHIEGLNESYLETKATVDALKKIKFSGYIQTQFQSAEVDGAATFAGGNFAANMHNRFMVRRGRLKLTYDNNLTNLVLQIDATERGLGLKDAYLFLKEPWLKSFGLKGGVFDRPFGFEIGYSSSSRETPERSRMFQTLFPGERDLGISVEYSPYSPFENFLGYFNFKAGFFAGNGSSVEVDNKKDFIGRLGFSLPFYEENLAIDGGVSIYRGGVKLAAGKSIFTVDNSNAASANVKSSFADRNYLGFDLQLYYAMPLLGNFSLRGEYISGKQPSGSSASSTSPTSLQTGDLFMRNFAGYYLNYVQNLGDKNQLVIKYDVYDPNIDVEGDQIGAAAAAKLGSGDIKYSTMGIGLIHYLDDNLKFVLYYDSVSNETTTKLAGFNSDLKDNVLTFRIQYKF
ncbi:MAG: phosphate-selective porin O and P [Ignavibacteria bacterium]|nr:MAG: phosphate-selective porin O and P [Ignavibacteria bacterium]KAF0161131.1 MAG: phosphate-selective porin O and P [Ignavibacteria bacterium]